MTLDEAIKQEEKLAKMSYELAGAYHTDENVYMTLESRLRERAEYHEQIVKWLEELQGLKKGSEVK